MLSLIIKELEANEISTLKSLWCILKIVFPPFHLHEIFCYPFMTNKECMSNQEPIYDYNSSIKVPGVIKL